MEKQRGVPVSLVGAPHWVLPIKIAFYSRRVKEWCGLQYPGHPRGCPNYAKANKPKCPYNSPYFPEFFDLSKPLFLVLHSFDLGAHMGRMVKRHPRWTERQQRNVLYWQGTVKKAHRQKLNQAMIWLGADCYCSMPETLGVQMYNTCRASGVVLEPIRGIKYVQFVGIVGWGNGKSF